MSDAESDNGFGLDDLLPEPESPTPVPFSFATYEPPEGFSLELPERRDRVVTRLVGSHPLWGHYLWNTSRVTSSYLLANPSLIQGRRVIELGAGAGLPSIVSASLGAEQVIVTDYPDAQLVENLRYNVQVNVAEPKRSKVAVDVGGSDAAIEFRADRKGFVWGANADQLLSQARATSSRQQGYDVMILSDLVFNHSQHKALIASVESLLAHSEPSSSTSSSASPDLAITPCVLVFITHHRPHLAEADMAFFPLLSESGDGWAYEQVVEEFAGAMFDEDPGDGRVRGTVKGWRAWRVRDGEPRGERIRPE